MDLFLVNMVMRVCFSLMVVGLLFVVEVWLFCCYEVWVVVAVDMYFVILVVDRDVLGF